MNIKTYTGLAIPDEAELAEVTARLSSFSSDAARDYVDSLVEHLCIHALAKLPPGFRRSDAIFKQVCALTGIRFEYAQVLQGLRRLAMRGEIAERNGSNDDAAEFLIQTEKISDLSKQHREFVTFEQQVIAGWKQELFDRYSNLTESDFEALLADLKSLSLRIYSQISVQNAFLYFSERNDLHELLEKVEAKTIDDILPQRENKVADIRAIELPRFFLSAPPDRQQYIAKQVNAFFALRMMQLDPQCVELVTQQVTGGVIFIDTNFIYRLLGINGNAELKKATEKLVETSQRLGYTVVVSPRTIEEYKTSLDTSYRRMSGYERIPLSVAQAAREAVLDTDFITHFMRVYAEKQGLITPTAYFAFYGNIESLLKTQYGIEVERQYDRHIRTHKDDLASEEARLRNAVWEWTPPHDSIVEHDAHMRLLVLLFRQGSEDLSPLETRCWFLTCDTKLVKYDRIRRMKEKLKVPFCILASQWAMLLSPFSITSEEYILAQAAVLESQIFRLFALPSSETIQEIMARMLIHEGYPPEIAARILLDSSFVRAFSKAKTETEKTQIFEDYFYGTFVVELEKEKEDLRNQIIELKSAVVALQNSSAASNTSDKVIVIQQQITSLEQTERSLTLTKHSDTYNVGQAGAVGPNSEAHHNQFIQQMGENFNAAKLAEELAQLRSAMKRTAQETDTDHDVEIGAIAAAEAAAKSNDTSGLVRSLASAGKWALQIAEKIGVSLAVEALKKSMGSA